MFEPAYLKLPAGELERRAEKVLASLASCRVCPRDCDVDRLQDKYSACKTGRYAVVSNYFPHHGEENCLRGSRGSGTIFFSHCNLRCVFCQNYDISQAQKPNSLPGCPPAMLASMMLELQASGCHNINFVTPEHVVPQILEALVIAVGAGLRLPIVYNTSAYDSLDSLEQMDGIVDIYMPDFKYWSNDLAKKYLKAENYPNVTRGVIQEMHRQVGPLVMDHQGIAKRGVLIRHLVMPGSLEETRNILTWIADALGSDTYVNLMDQYRPAGKVSRDRHVEINRSVTASEFLAAERMADELGFERLDRRRTSILV
ncbi:MAG: radical SAM protein [Rhodothermia bacterium]|nr:MAG: radical SAM protein [Rhodothermia bacterium]